AAQEVPTSTPFRTSEVALTEEFLPAALPAKYTVRDLIASDQLNVVSEEVLLYHVRLPLTGRDFLLAQVADEPFAPEQWRRKGPSDRGHEVPPSAGAEEQHGVRPCVFANFKNKQVVPIAGGGSLFAIHCECEYYNPRTDRWSPIASTSHRRSRAGVAGVGRLLVYAVGGYDGSKDLSSVECYNPLTNKWSPCPRWGRRGAAWASPPSTACCTWPGATTGRRASTASRGTTPSSPRGRRSSPWRPGGGTAGWECWVSYDGVNYVSSVERLDPREGKWQQMPHMINRRSSCGVAALDGMLYVVGGNDGSLCMCSVERFDPVKGTWEAMASMHTRRTTHEVVEAEGYLYAIGGNDGSSSLSTVERYDPRHNKWMLVTSMNLRRSSIGATVLECPNLERILVGRRVKTRSSVHSRFSVFTDGCVVTFHPSFAN
ncbi:kelch-like protein 17, partial [Caerostris extrusa]